jgi:serine/threonine protein kinase/tetratricopeptide (TPR) repeat protein
VDGTEDAAADLTVKRLRAARAEDRSLEADHALSRLESALFGAPEPKLALDRYPLIRKLGQGGSGVVYLAYDPRLDRKVAIKILRHADDASHGSTDGRARLVREAQAMARSPHPNIVAVYDVDTWHGSEEDEDGVFIVMEYVEGPELREWLRHTQHDWRETLDVFIAAGRGLAAAHHVSVVHRDFKPANVIVGDDGRVRVLDFGLARATGAATGDESLDSASIDPQDVSLDSPLTVAGTVLGTPAFMAPEQHTGAPADARSDQFSYCVALWEGLYGKRPFEAKSIAGLARQKLEHTPKPPEPTKVPTWLAEVLMRGLSPSPPRRWPSMQALLDELVRGAKRSRRQKRAAIVVASLATVGVGAWTMAQPDDSVCSGTSERVRTAWNPERRDAIESVFGATGLSYAADSFTRSADRFDVFFDTWADQYTDTCEATNVRGDQSTSVMDLRMACLGRQIRDVDALLTVFESADAKTVERSIRAASALPEPGECANVQALMASVAPPSDPTTATAVEQVREELARARAMERAGQFAEALPITQALVERATALDYPPALAEALSARGSLEDWNGQYDDAEATLSEAHAIAISSGHDREAALASKTLVFVLGERKARLPSALSWAQISAAELDRTGADEKDRAALLAAKSTALRVGGRFEEARVSGLEALEIIERVTDDEDDPNVATLHNNLGEVYRELGDAPEALRRQRKALEIRMRVLGPDHPDIASSLNNLGNALLEAEQNAEAETAYRKAVPIREAALGPDHPKVAHLLNNLGIALRRQKKYDEARETYARVLEIMRAHGSEKGQLGYPLNSLGLVLLDQGDPEGALAYFEQARVAWLEGLGADHPNLGRVLSNLGAAQWKLGRHQDASQSYERAIAIIHAAMGAKSARLGTARFEYARALEDAGEHARAKTMAGEALDALADGADPELTGEIEAWLADHP